MRDMVTVIYDSVNRASCSPPVPRPFSALTPGSQQVQAGCLGSARHEFTDRAHLGARPDLPARACARSRPARRPSRGSRWRVGRHPGALRIRQEHPAEHPGPARPARRRRLPARRPGRQRRDRGRPAQRGGRSDRRGRGHRGPAHRPGPRERPHQSRPRGRGPVDLQRRPGPRRAPARPDRGHRRGQLRRGRLHADEPGPGGWPVRRWRRRRDLLRWRRWPWHRQRRLGGGPRVGHRHEGRRLRANAARSALTVLGIVIGVGSVVTLVAVGNGSAAEVNSQFSGLGANTLTVTSGRGFGGGLRGVAGSGTPLTIQHVDAIQRAPGIAAVAPIVQVQANISVGDTTVQSPVVGTTPSYVKVNGLQLASGSSFSDFADARRLQVAVLGATLTSDLGLAPRQAVGSTVNVRGLPYTVIGVLQSQGGAGFVNPDDNLLVPLDTMAGRVTSADPDVSQIRVAAAPDAVSTFGNSVIAALRDSHGLASDQDNDFLVINPNSLIQAQQTSSDNFTRLITAIAAISLVVGGIGIANVMLVAVRERTQEIGIRRAIGAKRRDIVAQFLTEATVLSLLGGLLGVAAGLGLAYALPHLADQRTIVSYPAGALALGISAVVGIIAGLGPANQAASLDPAEALRYE